VPERMRPPDGFDVNRVSWLTDVTPTLYALMGAAPRSIGDMTGRPLFGSVPGASDMALVQSSYSRIFGLLDRDARWLYTADANRLTEEFFDLTASPPAQVTPQEADRLQYHRWLLDRVNRLNAFYTK